MFHPKSEFQSTNILICPKMPQELDYFKLFRLLTQYFLILTFSDIFPVEIEHVQFKACIITDRGFLGGALTVQWHIHCLLQQYLPTKETNLGYSVASANANTAFLARVPNGKESESVGSLGIVAVQLLPFTHTCALELANLSFRICLTCTSSQGTVHIMMCLS